MRSLQRDIAEFDAADSTQNLEGIGEAISEKIHEFLMTGKIGLHEKLRKQFPKALLALLDVPSLGPKKVHLLWEELKVHNRKSLKKALKDGSVEALPGFGAKSVQNILQGLELAEPRHERKSFVEMVPIEKKMREYLKRSRLVSKLEAAGSFRRKKSSIGDLDFLALSKKPQDLIQHFVSHPDTAKVLAQGLTKGSIILKGGPQVDLRVVRPDEWGAALLYFTGSKEHNIQLRSRALRQGMTINEYGIFLLDADRRKGKKVAGKTEEECFRILGLRYIPSEKRLGSGEIEEAELKSSKTGKI